MQTICVLTSAHPALDKRVFRREAVSLVTAGYRVILVAPHSRKEVVEQVAIWPIKASRRRIARFARTCLVLRLALQARADAYHLHDPELLPIGLMLKAITGKPVIYDAHEYTSLGILWKDWIPKAFRPLLSWLTRHAEPWMARRLTAVLVVTSHMEELFRSKGCETLLVRNLPITDGVNLSIPLEKKRQVLYLGFLSRARGLEVVIRCVQEAIARRLDVRFLVVGRTLWDGVKPELRSLAAECERSGVLTFRDEVPFPTAEALLRESAIGWIPYQRDPQAKSLELVAPVKLFEYALYGLPIVASRIGKTAELVEELDCGLLVKPNVPVEHVNAIESLLQDHRLALEYGKRGQDRVLSGYSWEHEAERLVDFYDRLLLEHKDSPSLFTDRYERFKQRCKGDE